MVGSQAASPLGIKQAVPFEDQPTHVLLAEDDELLAKGLSLHVQQLGYCVVGPAANGQQAIELATQHKPDLALMDIRMPVVSGLDAAAVLFEQLGIPVILLSAHCDQEYVKAGQRVGVFGYLVKPVTVDQIRVNIAVAWARYGQHLALHGQVEELKTALEDRKFIERAKGLLMDKLGLGENEAMSRLKKQARDSRRRLSDLARVLVESKQLFAAEPSQLQKPKTRVKPIATK